jgi:predicted DNA binding CopG/RHH family protein
MEPFLVEKEEKEIEDYLAKYLQLNENKDLSDLLKGRVNKSTNSTKSITIRISEEDIEVMKIKASKLGLPYQTYIKMVIHKDASEK